MARVHWDGWGQKIFESLTGSPDVEFMEFVENNYRDEFKSSLEGIDGLSEKDTFLRIKAIIERDILMKPKD